MKLLSIVKSALASSLRTSPTEKFDLTTVEGIRAIPKTAVAKSLFFSTDQIEYVLQRKATQYKSEGNLDLAIECLRKSNELKQYSHTVYSAKDYYRLVDYLKLARRFDEAREEKAKLDTMFNEKGISLDLIDECEKKAIPPKNQKNDLVSIGYLGCCCSECAKFRCRVYSYYGKDPRFPRYPDFLKQNPDHCGLMAFPFLFDCQSLSMPSGKELRGASLIKYSNRPFVDDRSAEEKELYEKQIADAEKDRIDRTAYDWLWEYMPEICPKGYGAYRRMRNSNSRNFQRIQQAALEHGFDLLTGTMTK